MRNLRAALVVLCAISTAGEVCADVGPAPKCPDGTYSAYLRGRHCVKNGYVLSLDAAGNPQETRGPDAVDTPRGPESDRIPPKGPEKLPEKLPEKPAEKLTEKSPEKLTDPPAKASGCAMSDHSGGGSSSLALMGAFSLLLLARRRRASVVAE